MEVALAPAAHVRDRTLAARAASDALPVRRVVRFLAALAALSAIGGGVALLLAPSGADTAPLSLLAGTPFTSFVVPALLLALVVGGTSAACFVSVQRHSPFAIDATILAGGTLTLWIVCELAILRQFSLLQVVYGGLGLALLVLGVIGALRSPEPRHGWVVGVTLGEALGFLVPSLVEVGAVLLELDVGLRAALLVLAGAVEGLLCGAGQAFAFPLPVHRARFAALTSVSAAAVWALAMGVVALGHSGASEVAMIVALALVIPVGLVLMGAAQWLELREHAFRAHRWVVWSALAWALALPASFLPMPLVDETTPLTPMIVLWASAGVLMAYVMALVTWQGARRLAA